MEQKRAAIISVSDKAGLQDLARGLQKRGIHILSTGGTAHALQDFGIEVEEVGHYTGFPELMGGRVKTLHPKVHGGILYRRGDTAHEQDAREHGIMQIDFVACNLYPFWRAAANENLSLLEVIENIDIGGSTLLRAAAKNYESVTALSNPKQYLPLLDMMDAHGGTVPRDIRVRLALEAFRHTADYDRQIADWFESQRLFQPLHEYTLEQLRQLPHNQLVFALACGEHLSSEAAARLCNEVDMKK